MKNIFYKIHSNSLGNILAVCDKEVVGKNLEEGNYFLEVKESFYKGKEVNAEELAEKLKEFENINLVGEKCIGVALKEEMANEKSVIKIAKVPHLQIFKI